MVEPSTTMSGQRTAWRAALWAVAALVPATGFSRVVWRQETLVTAFMVAAGVAMLAALAWLYHALRAGRDGRPVAWAALGVSLGSCCGVLLGGGSAAAACRSLYGLGLLAAILVRGHVLKTGVIVMASTVFSGWVQSAGDASPYLVRGVVLDSCIFVALVVGVSAVARRFDRVVRDKEAARRRSDDLERSRMASERIDLLAQIASGVAHGVNNPLAVLRSNVAFLRGEVQAMSECNPEIDEVFDETLASLARIQRIVVELQDLARDEVVHAERVAADELVREAVRLADEHVSKVACLTLDATDMPAEIEVSPHRFVQVIHQILINAAEAVELGRPVAPWVGVRTEVEKGRFRVIVENNGRPIAPGTLARVFDPFFTTKASGKGLGLSLAIARELVQRHAGSIWAENRAEGGARFVVELPMAGSPPGNLRVVVRRWPPSRHEPSMAAGCARPE